MKKRLYIAYGSNLNKEQMSWRCPGAKVVAKSWLHDYRLVFQGSTYNAHANVIPAKGYDVPVAIWEINEHHEMALDRYEGVRGGYYTKETMTVEVDGKLEDALIYIMSPNPYGIPSDAYLNTIVQGYRDFNLETKVLNDAALHAIRRTKRSRLAAFGA